MTARNVALGFACALSFLAGYLAVIIGGSALIWAVS